MAPSFTYRFFNISQDSSHFSCKLCNQEIQGRKSDSSLHTSPLFRHLRRKHPEVISHKSAVNVESELKTFLNPQGAGCSTESYTRDSSPGRVEQSDVSTFRDPDVNSATNYNDIIQKIFDHVEDVMKRLTNVEAMLAKCDVSDLSDNDSDCDDEIQKQNEEPYEHPKRNIITVKGFSFEDYPH